jgi:hypothetical protein
VAEDFDKLMEDREQVVREPSVRGRRNTRRTRTRAVVLAVVTVVVAGAVVGVGVWRAQPSYCGAVCHEPMNAYVYTYMQDPGVPGVDKWGNALADAGVMLSVTHANAGLTCQDCHERSFADDARDARALITDGYSYVETALFGHVLPDLDIQAALREKGADDAAFCLRSGCHTMRSGREILTREELAASTSLLAFNPHHEHAGRVPCTYCHHAHRAFTICKSIGSFRKNVSSFFWLLCYRSLLRSFTTIVVYSCSKEL